MLASSATLAPGTATSKKVFEEIAKVTATFKITAIPAEIKSTLKASGTTVLDAIAAKIVNEDAYVELVNVTGYADTVGSDAYNMSLSQRRATTVANYLKSKGVAASKIKVIAKGESEATGKTAAERAKDRKVVIDIHMTN